MEFVGEIDEELSVLVDIKTILSEVLKAQPNSSLQEKLLLTLNNQMNMLAEIIKSNNRTEWRHTPSYDKSGKIEQVITQPIKR